MDKVDRPSLNDESGEMSCTRSFQRRAMFKAHTKQGLKCTFSPDSTLLATSSADQSIKFWKTSDFSIMNPAGVVQFDDPFESIQDKATGHASSASTIRRGSTTVTSTFKNTYSNNIENESELNQFGGESQQASRLPACFLKPKRNRCQMCHNLSSSNKASSDETSQTDRKNCSM
ncbi:Target of rapamycin complex subunit lst8, partial [Blomia tropicalis]